MTRRRQPPLFEFLGAPDRRGTLVADGSALGRRPVEVAVQRPTPSVGTRPIEPGAQAAGALAPARAVRIPFAVLALTVAGGLALAAVIWALAFNMGQQEKEKQLAPHLGDSRAGAGAVPGSELPRTTGATLGAGVPVVEMGFTPPEPAASPPAPEAVAPVPGDDVRRAGMNYLELCVLTYKDAQSAAEYLGRNGVRAGLAPARNVDPGKARANNLPHLLFVTDGVASDRFKATTQERKALEAKVEQIGKRWQREERGASDFSRPVWRLFKGRD